MTAHGKYLRPSCLPNGCNLDRKNPSAKEDFAHLPPEVLAKNILDKEQKIATIITNITQLLAVKA